jgi:hypothetical protein
VNSITNSINIEANEIYNGKKKIYGDYETCCITSEKVTKILNGLPAKRCYGFDRIPLIFLKNGAEILETILSQN